MVPFEVGLINKYWASRQEIADLKAENARLRAALEKYGRHDDTCDAEKFRAVWSPERHCDCGYSAALEEQP
jgi:hypothetical protein